MKTVLLLFSSARFAMPLIRYLVIEGRRYGWKTCVGSMFNPDLTTAIKREKFSSEVVFVNISDYRQCDHAIRKADIVAGMLPDSMMLQVLDLCIANKKNFITPARLNRQILSRKPKIEEKDILVLMECGFAPGLDHVTACKAIDNIHSRGGSVSSFKTFHGTLPAEGCVNNPWEVSLFEPAADIISMGRHNNRYLLKGKILHAPYHQLFERTQMMFIPRLGEVTTITEGDGLYLRKIYNLTEAHTVMKGRILRPGLATIWKFLVKLGLTDIHSRIEMFEKSSFYNFLDSLLPYSEAELLEYRLKKYAGASDEDIHKLQWLGFFDHEWLSAKEPTPAMILRHLMENKLQPQENDRDCIVMKHVVQYTLRNVQHTLEATLVVEGEVFNDPANAKATAFMTGAAIKACLLDNIKARGLQLPISQDIYDPVLSELDDLGVAFHVEEDKQFGLQEQAGASDKDMRTAASW